MALAIGTRLGAYEITGQAGAGGMSARTYDVARDGRFLMIDPSPTSDGARPANIVIVQNFNEELKARVRPSGQ